MDLHNKCYSVVGIPWLEISGFVLWDPGSDIHESWTDPNHKGLEGQVENMKEQQYAGN